MSRLRWWFPALVWAVVIFQFSTDRFSSEHTAGIVLTVLRIVLRHASETTLDTLHHVVRKGAHFVEYFIFGLLLLYGARGPERGWKLRWALTALAIAAVYAASDEFHQVFVPSRGASVWDALLDTASACVAQLAAWQFLTRKNRLNESDGLQKQKARS
jgi:VanZ family protein